MRCVKGLDRLRRRYGSKMVQTKKVLVRLHLRKTTRVHAGEDRC